MKIAMVAGEPSGDTLGKGLIDALRIAYPQTRFEGIGGAQMTAAGLHSFYPLEKLAVMGAVEVLRHLPGLLHIRRTLIKHFLADPPAVFIGIDAPDFNLPLEHQLRCKGIKTVHYVSPQLWAWRPGRVRQIARATDLMLTVLPFEADFYQTHGMNARYVGHPLADAIPFHNDRQRARCALGYVDHSKPLVALLPGSRLSEVRCLGPLFLAVARWLQSQGADLGYIVPAATPTIHGYLATWLEQHVADLPVLLVHGRAREAMTAADVVLVASGTATLEALLLKRPMVVAYKVAPITAWLLSKLITVPYISLPNLLAQRDLVPEFVQQAATVENLGTEVLKLLEDPSARVELEEIFSNLHQQLRCKANMQAATAIADLLNLGSTQNG